MKSYVYSVEQFVELTKMTLSEGVDGIYLVTPLEE